MTPKNWTVPTVLLVNLSSQNAIRVSSKSDLSQIMIWVCVIFHLQVFIYIINCHKNHYEYLDLILSNMTYARFVTNVEKYTQNHKLKVN